jgi:hypothetical protein
VAAPKVELVGLKALRRDISRLSTDVSGPFFRALKAAGLAAAEPVAAATRSAVPHDSGDLAATVRTSGTRTGGAVRMGRASVPYAGWVEFGGVRPDGSERDYVAGGRYLFPAAANLAERAAREYARALEGVFDQSGLWTNTGTDPRSVHD